MWGCFYIVNYPPIPILDGVDVYQRRVKVASVRLSACFFIYFGPTTAVARAHMIALVIDWQLIVREQILNYFERFLTSLNEGSTR